MKALIFLTLFLSLLFGDFLVVGKEDKNKQTTLQKLHSKFLKIDVNSEELDLDKAIKDIKQARKKFPLDDKLKMIDIELEHRRANESYNSTKNPTPNN